MGLLLLQMLLLPTSAFLLLPGKPSSTPSSPTQLSLSSFVDGVALYTINVPRTTSDGTTGFYKLSFRYVPRHTRKPPVVVLHGGPSLTSAYLYNLADLGFRSMLFYDQLGVGQSEEPAADDDVYSIALAVQDLEYLIQAVLGPQQPYHLYAHSYGGLLAYEFLSHGSPAASKCRSVVCSSAHPSSPAVRAAYETRLAEYGGHTTKFAAQHVCRIPAPPLLAAAYAYPGRIWTGMTPYADYVASPRSDKDEQRLSTPCLGLQGEFDFVDTSPWQDYFENFRNVVLPNCSHHGLYENPGLYAQTLRNFWSEYDV